MKFVRTILLPLVVFLFAALVNASAAERFRTDINPALLYWQAVGEMPALPEPDRGYLFTNEWRGRELDERFGQLVSRYDYSFKLLRRAAKAQVPCDWGYDLTDGPDALLPSLAKAKLLSQAARLRARWHLERGDQAAARDDLLAAFVLGRNVSKDGILISALVQIAIENILGSAIAENYFRFSPETFQQIAAGLETGPARGLVAQCIPVERSSFSGWLIRSVEDFQANSNDEPKIMAQIRELLGKLTTDGDGEDSDPTLPDRIIKAAGGTSAGMIRYVKELDPLYDEADVLLTLPYREFLPRIKAFNEKVVQHPNLVVHVLFPVLDKCRLKELAIEVKLAMLRAAAAYRLDGEDGLKRVLDPASQEPFQFERFSFEGADRGFQLKSRMVARDWVESLIFIEKDGPPFYLDGINAGKKVK